MSFVLSHECAVRPSPVAFEANIGIAAGDSVQAGSSGGLAIGEYRIAWPHPAGLMILIPNRLRSQGEVSAAAVTDCHVVSASSISAVHILKFLSINNDFLDFFHDSFSFSKSGSISSGVFCFVRAESFFFRSDH